MSALNPTYIPDVGHIRTLNHVLLSCSRVVLAVWCMVGWLQGWLNGGSEWWMWPCMDGGWHFLRVLPEPCSGSGKRGRGTTTSD